MNYQKGFTLIESIIAIIILAIAMLTVTTMLFPSLTRSAEPQYQVRAAALSETIFSQILSRSFDHNSDHQGGFFRCGEADYIDEQGNPILCTPESEFGPLKDESGTILENIADYNDVDDYGDSSGTTVTYTLNPDSAQRDLSQLIMGTTDYANFHVDITVTYEELDVLKRIQLDISAGSHGPYRYTAYKGNY